jgi:RNA polymerase sigma-70 factor, ECF subfamily
VSQLHGLPVGNKPNSVQPVNTPEMLEQLYTRYHQHVFHLALRYSSGRIGWAEDIAHDVFVRMLSTPLSLYDLEDLEGWFYLATTRRCLNRLRHEALTRSAPVRWLLGHMQPSVEVPEAQALVRAELRAVGQALESLPAKERVAFCMFHLDAKTLVEIGQVMGHSKGYVSKLIQRATEQLREAGWDVGGGV